MSPKLFSLKLVARFCFVNKYYLDCIKTIYITRVIRVRINVSQFAICDAYLGQCDTKNINTNSFWYYEGLFLVNLFKKSIYDWWLSIIIQQNGTLLKGAKNEIFKNNRRENQDFLVKIRGGNPYKGIACKREGSFICNVYFSFELLLILEIVFISNQMLV